jgi:hypothetical protein
VRRGNGSHVGCRRLGRDSRRRHRRRQPAPNRRWWPPHRWRPGQSVPGWRWKASPGNVVCITSAARPGR